MTEEPKPRKESLAARLKAEQMEQGEDGKMHRKVPTAIKIRAFLAIALPAVLLLLIGLGFVPMLEGERTLWQAVGEKFFGGGDPSAGRGPDRERFSSAPIDVEKYRSIARQDDRGSLTSGGMDVEDAIREVSGRIEREPDPEQAKKLAEQRRELEAALAEIQKKLNANKPPETIIESGRAAPKK